MPFDGRLNETEKVVRALKGTRAELQKGWSRGSARSRDGMCLVLTVCVACDYDPVLIDSTIALVKIAVEERYQGANSLILFNDSPGRTRDEVIEVVDLATSLAVQR